VTIVAVGVLLALGFALVVPRMRRGDFRYRDVLLFTVAFTLPLRNISLLTVAGGNVRLGDLVILIAAGTLAFELVFGVVRVRLTQTHVLLILFVAWCFCTIVWSLDPRFGVTRSLKYLRDLLLFGFAAAWSYGRFDRALRVVSAGVLVSFALIYPLAMLSASERLAQLTFGRQPGRDLSILRGEGGIGPVTYAPEATVIEVAFWTNIAIWLLLSQGGWMAGSRVKRAVFWLAMFALLSLEVMTFSRGLWLALGVAGVLWLVWIGPGVRRPLLIGIALIAIAASAAAYRLDLHRMLARRVASFVAGDADLAISLRFKSWKASIDALETRPMGVGIGGTKVAVERKGGIWFVHNLYLQLLAELGPIGFALALGALLLSFARARIAAGCAADPHLRVAAASIAAAIVSYLVLGLVYLDFADLEIWLLLAFATSLPPCPSRS